MSKIGSEGPEAAGVELAAGAPVLSEREGQILLKTARGAICRRLGMEAPASPSATGLHRPGAAFVTLRVDAQLRGCIGTTEPVLPLLETVRECAVGAAFRDPRFPPLQRQELPHLQIEVSILGPVRDLADPSQIQIGRDGLLVSKEERKGLLLPQVAAEHGLDPVTFLEWTCQKARLPPAAWRGGARVQVFQVQVFVSRP